ncbi:hypothetical protein Y1Q_0006889 [Alligator mississippiensis]|uniref:Major facilitator superfamily (MFS) profile domain-containing protein n=1 Tax=Alligator mississippiensis TaxID=8496 RepID=A0A151MTJ4_ALLMI|nr:hypothetical protein Y1Q_0006889 [Alligator mississippiensis]
MAFADLLADTGSMGRFQVLNVALLVLPILILSCHNLLQNFTAATPGHRCRLPCDTNATGCLGRLASFVPLDREGQAETCVQFLGAQGELLNPEGPGGNGTHGATEPCGDGWTYDRSVFASTIVTEWDLVCSSRSLKQMAQSIYMAGVLVGAVVFGSLSDKFGRKSLLIWSCLQMAVTGSCAAFAPSFTTYCLFRFLTGMALSGISLNCMSLAVEWTPTNVRAVVGMVTGYSYSVGQFLLAGVAYVIPDWRWLQLAVSLPYFVFFLYSWFSTSFAYYGLAMDLQKFGVSIYLIQVIFGAVDIPAKLIGFCVINFIGRRVTQATALLLAGLAILANIFVPQDLQTMRTVLAVFGKGCLAASFNCVFLYTGELYPTVIRQTGMGLGNTLARVGGIVAPLVRMTSDYSPSLPLIIYGAAPVISGIATCFLPETLNMPLPDTIEDVERQRCSEMRWKDTIQQPSHPDPHKEVL